MKLMKIKLKFLVLTHACFATHFALAQAGEPPQFFEPSTRSNEERRQLYEESRGSFLDMDASEVAMGSLVQQGFSADYSSIRALEFLLRAIERDNGRHVIYLNISDQEFEALTPMLENFTSNIERATDTEVATVCNRLRVDLAAKASNAHETAYRGFEDSQLKASQQKILIIDGFYRDVERELGIRVVDQLEKYVDIFSRKNSFNISLTPPASMTPVPHTPANYMNRICKSTLGA